MLSSFFLIIALFNSGIFGGVITGNSKLPGKISKAVTDPQKRGGKTVIQKSKAFHNLKTYGGATAGAVGGGVLGLAKGGVKSIYHVGRATGNVFQGEFQKAGKHLGKAVDAPLSQGFLGAQKGFNLGKEGLSGQKIKNGLSNAGSKIKNTGIGLGQGFAEARNGFSRQNFKDSGFTQALGKGIDAVFLGGSLGYNTKSTVFYGMKPPTDVVNKVNVKVTEATQPIKESKFRNLQESASSKLKSIKESARSRLEKFDPLGFKDLGGNWFASGKTVDAATKAASSLNRQDAVIEGSASPRKRSLSEPDPSPQKRIRLASDSAALQGTAKVNEPSHEAISAFKSRGFDANQAKALAKLGYNPDAVINLNKWSSNPPSAANPSLKTEQSSGSFSTEAASKSARSSNGWLNSLKESVTARFQAFKDRSRPKREDAMNGRAEEVTFSRPLSNGEIAMVLPPQIRKDGSRVEGGETIILKPFTW